MPVEEPLIGREREQSALIAAVARAREGEGSILLLTGEAGVGKTMLARRALGGSGLRLLEAFGVQEGASAYGPVAEILRQLQIEPALRSRLAMLLPVSPIELPSGEAYWELFSTSYGPTKTLADALGDRREELHWAWVDFFESNHRTNGQIEHPREYLLVVGQRR